ncbi:MutS-related protein [Halomarina oriensis]|uniref:DNA-binding protein MutS2 n=1 Tax=Halomarina oriensis TaxID=671145 RepID=A0A6B0GRJ8_9EURY|nr:helix-hairpin-helix domain-containing protein [Halomarina oriensis]MWG34745.1 endonuclease MutS2 [Halomarina oriensis]
MDLEAIQGVGSKTADRLRQLDDAERALEAGDVAALARAPGITEGTAARIARNAIRQRHGDTEDFLRTDRARELYGEALSLVQERAVTEYARKRLETFYPSASASRIAEVQAFVEAAAEHDPTPEVREALAGVEPLTEPRDLRVRDRCVATGDAETYARAEAAFPEVSVELVEDATGIGELARGYSTVVVLDERFAGLDIDGDVRVLPDAFDRVDEVVPERLLRFFADNRERLAAAATVHERAGLDPACDLDVLRDGLERLTDDGTVKGDADLHRLRDAVDDLDVAVSTAESVANDRLREAIQSQDVTIEGADLLSLVEQGARVDSLLETELADEFDAAIAAARDHLADALAVPDYDDLVEQAFVEEPTFPVEHQEEAVNRLRRELKAARDRRAATLKATLAADLADLRDPAGTLVRAALDLDVELAVARYAADFDCTVPEFVERDGDGAEGTSAGSRTASRSGDGTDAGLVVEGGRSPLLDVDFEEVDPVDYGVEGVALLSGVNSGGKTSTIDLVGLVVVLAQMGLPVPAERVELRRFDALHYQAKSQGTLDAGAFEATLREFGDLVEGPGVRLVLVDELESITEPGASARIIAGILESLHEQRATAVFVSHLAGEIRDATEFDVQVDGIEAVGLVDGELQVNRSPVKGRLARSTPELIVEKLADDAGDGDGFYRRLLAKFE